MAAVDFGACQRYLTLHVKQVLHGIRHARERRQGLAPCAHAVHLSGFAARPLVVLAGKCVDPSVRCFDARHTRLKRLHCTDLAGGDRAGQCITCQSSAAIHYIIHSYLGT